MLRRPEVLHISPHLLGWHVLAPSSRLSLAPVGASLCTRAAEADPGVGSLQWQMLGSQWHFPGDTPTVLFNQAPFHRKRRWGRIAVRMHLPLQRACERACVFVSYYPSHFACKTAAKKEEYRCLWLPGPCMPESHACCSELPDGGRTVCVCLIFFVCFLYFLESCEMGEAGTCGVG